MKRKLTWNTQGKTRNLTQPKRATKKKPSSTTEERKSSISQVIAARRAAAQRNATDPLPQPSKVRSSPVGGTSTRTTKKTTGRGPLRSGALRLKKARRHLEGLKIGDRVVCSWEYDRRYGSGRAQFEGVLKAMEPIEGDIKILVVNNQDVRLRWYASGMTFKKVEKKRLK